jgi:hypothetical protein
MVRGPRLHVEIGHDAGMIEQWPDRLVVRPLTPADAEQIVGAGHGVAFGTAVVNHYQRDRLRAVVQSWNERSLRLTRSLGFVETGTHVCVQDGAPVTSAVVETGAPRPVR